MRDDFLLDTALAITEELLVECLVLVLSKVIEVHERLYQRLVLGKGQGAVNLARRPFERYVVDVVAIHG